MKSSIAEPSRRNSGFDATLKECGSGRHLSTISRMTVPVPAGTVLFVTITL